MILQIFDLCEEVLGSAEELSQVWVHILVRHVSDSFGSGHNFRERWSRHMWEHNGSDMSFSKCTISRLPLMSPASETDFGSELGLTLCLDGYKPTRFTDPAYHLTPK